MIIDGMEDYYTPKQDNYAIVDGKIAKYCYITFDHCYDEKSKKIGNGKCDWAFSCSAGTRFINKGNVSDISSQLSFAQKKLVREFITKNNLKVEPEVRHKLKSSYTTFPVPHCATLASQRGQIYTDGDTLDKEAYARHRNGFDSSHFKL